MKIGTIKPETFNLFIITSFHFLRVAKEHRTRKVEIVNRKAKFEYHFITEIEAGIMLTGTEIKSIRANNANLKEAYCAFKDGELFIRGMHISEYKYGTHNNHDPVRTRKLLLKKAELKSCNKIKQTDVNNKIK